MDRSRRIRSWPEIVAIAFALSIGLLLTKFLFRPILFGSPVIKGDEVEDTILWFAFMIIALVLERYATKSWNAERNS